jgi:hypothetical protein
MTHTLSPSAPLVLHEYYSILTAGSEAFGDGAGLSLLLSDHLDFTGALAGHRPDATDAFLRGVAGFIATASGIHVVTEVHDDRGSAVLYDAQLPAGVVRFAEFFTFENGVIGSLQLHYNGQDYIDKGGR